MIAELRDEACTQWASGWLAFQHRASRAFPNLEFNFQLSDEEAEESLFEAEAEAEVLFGASNRAALPDDLQVPLEASSPTLPARALPFNPPPPPPPPASMSRGLASGA